MNLKSRLKFIFILFVMLHYGCDIHSNKQIHKPAANTRALKQPSAIIWSRLQSNFCLNLASDNSYVQFHAAKYKKQTQYLQQVTDQATPYLSHIIEQLEQRNMPGELALLPMIESAYNPFAVSNMGAAGIWQLGAKTGKRYGLKQNNWYDGRKDIRAATTAALDYLQFLYQEFDEDWFLALAAYNAGEGRVRQAIKHNLAANKPTDFWSLKLPKQTRNFVPKFLALANLVKHTDFDDITFHTTIAKINAKKLIPLNA